MATKYGDFVGKNGHEYVVEFEGANVEHAALTLGVPPVIISMAEAEHKGVGYKSTTAVVNIITDKPLVDLYASTPTDVKLTVTDMTTGDFLFDGYVTPFAFNQAFTGKADTFTVNAVDLLTARKGEKYASIGGYGTDQPAYAIVEAIAERSGIVSIVEHINFDTIDPDNGTSPLGVMVAQAGFLQDEVSDLDALSAICKFFGYTSCVVGNVLYLYDEHCLLHADDLHARNAGVYDYRNGAWVEKIRYFNSANTPLATQQVGTIHNDINVTIERAWDGVQITTEGSDTSVLLPDVCADDQQEDLDYDDGRTPLRTFANDEAIIYRTPRRSKVVKTGRAGTSGDTITNLVGTSNSDYMTEGDPNKSTYWANGSVLMRYAKIDKTKVVVNEEEVTVCKPSESAMMLWVRLRTVAPGANPIVAMQQRDGVGYSHTGGLARVSVALKMRYPNTSSQYMPPTGDEVDQSVWRMPWLQLRCGDKYLHRVTAADVLYEWGSAPPSPFIKGEDGNVVPSADAREHYDEGYVVSVPENGRVYLEIAKWHEQGVRDYYFTRMMIEGVGDAINLEHPDMLHGNKAGELLEVSTMLTTRKSGMATEVTSEGKRPYGVNARPAVVTDTEWPGGYMGRADVESIPISGILMEQLRERYAIPRPRYQMTVEGNINPYASVVFGGRGYTVEAYERDLYNDTTNITIN